MNVITEFRKEVRKCLELANAKYNLFELMKDQCIDQDISVNFYTAGTSAGWASHLYQGGKIKRLSLRFNSVFIEDDYDYMVNDTIPHEVAHLMCYLLYPKEQIGHNHQWNEICRNLGGTGRRYHTMKPLKSNKKEMVYEYQIDDKHVYLPSKVHFKAQKSFTNHPIDGIMTRVFKTMYTGKMCMSEK